MKNGDFDSAISTIENILEGLQTVVNQISNPEAYYVQDYLNWVDATEVHLRHLFADAAHADALHTERYWRIATHTVPVRDKAQLIAEISVQKTRHEELLASLRRFLSLRDRPGQIAMLDTNVLLHFHQIDKIKWREVTGAKLTRLVIPLLVLDELDDKRYLGSDKIKSKARSAIEPLDALQEQLAAEGFASLPHEATVEYLIDERGHQRQNNPDEELLDRAELLAQITGQEIIMVTDDRGCRVRATARRTGLRAVLIPQKFAREQITAPHAP